MKGVTNVQMDHDRAAMLALKHLYELGHRRVAFMKGQPHALDSESRWQGILSMARNVGLEIDEKLCVYLEVNSWSPELGYPIIHDLLQRTRDFTAVFCFNDIAAIGAIRAIADCGLRCPEDISVIGFDDIASAAYHVPRLTTVRQPLRRMGEVAVQILLKRIENPEESYPDTIMFEPELMVRESTGPISKSARSTQLKSRSGK
jgi:DNA-binding LacI/PurR family transcriptional regulator